jgi:hypothetical protein
MKKTFFLFYFLIFTSPSWSQVNVISTDSFTIQATGQDRFTFSLRSINDYHVQSLGDIATLNHMGQVKTKRTNVKGIPLKDILDKVSLAAVKPKDLFSYYLVLEATDGYKVVLSRNEVAGANNFYIITESEGRPWPQSGDRIELLELVGQGKGHIYIKGLKGIYLRKVD